jgi:hypothetical protein
MSKNFRSRLRSAEKCSHTTELRMEIAGMSRTVCEHCGRVSVAYIDDHLRRTRLSQAAIKESVAS